MKFKLQLKDPDGVYESVQEAVGQEVAQIQGLSQAERKELTSRRVMETFERLQRWVAGGEYLTLEVDIEAGTAVVLEQRS